MQRRSPRDRRTDSATAERFDLAVLAARAFDLRAGRTYLRLSGISSTVVQGFVDRYPGALRLTMSLPPSERRRTSTQIPGHILRHSNVFADSRDVRS